VHKLQLISIYKRLLREFERTGRGLDAGLGSVGPWAKNPNGPINRVDHPTGGRGFGASLRMSKNTINAKRRLGDERFEDDDEEEDEKDEEGKEDEDDRELEELNLMQFFKDLQKG